MKKLIKDFLKDPKYFTDRFTGKRRISASDNAYLENNGKAIKAVYKLMQIFGNKYSGK